MLSEGWSELTAGVEVFFRRGEKPGPLALVTAGVHGDEYEGPAAAAMLAAKLQDLPLSGSVAVIPVANPMAWRASQRVSPDDGLNLARTFPGDATGSPTQRLAAKLWELAEQVDYLIDLHSGGVEYSFLPLCGFYGDPAPGNPSFDAARRFGLPVLWNLPPTDGVLSCELWKRGRTVVGCEYLGSGQLSLEGRDKYLRGILSCLAVWNIADVSLLLPDDGEACTGNWQLADAEGLFVPSCAIGEKVAGAQPLAVIQDIRGRILQRFTAPAEGGFVLAIRSEAYIRQGNWGVLIASRI